MADQPTATYLAPGRLVFHCVFRIGMNQFFLVAESEREERVIIVVLSAEEFAFLRRLGIPECTVVGSSSGMPGMPGMPSMSA